MIAVANVFVNAVFDPDHTFAPLEQPCQPGLDSALTFQLAFTLGNDDFQAHEICGESLVERLAHFLNVIRVHRTHPFDAKPLKGVFNGLVGMRHALQLVSGLMFCIVARCRDDVLRARC